MSNPDWSRDELILALEFYLSNNKKLNYSRSDTGINRLSNLLKKMPFNPAGNRDEKYRNFNGVRMKLANFARFDPDYKGAGLSAGNKLEKEVWEEYSKDLVKLKKTSTAIIKSITTPDNYEIQSSSDLEEDDDAPEGRVLTRVHSFRERNRKLVKRKKLQVLEKYGSLKCEVCQFSFEEKYGGLGKDFAECHHVVPLSELKPGQRTKLSDLVILCSNCHRMIHKSKKWLKVDELKALIRN